jgi:hypothetical protein
MLMVQALELISDAFWHVHCCCTLNINLWYSTRLTDDALKVRYSSASEKIDRLLCVSVSLAALREWPLSGA